MINNRRLVALCTSRIYDPQIHNFIKTLNEQLYENNCFLFIFSMNSDIYWDEQNTPAEAYIFDLLPYRDLDCIMIMDEKIKSKTVSKKIISRANENHVPVFTIDGTFDRVPSVCFDYRGGFEQMVRHVIEHHRVKRPHMMAGFPGNPFSEERIEVFKEVLADNHIPFDESMVSYGHFWADPTLAAMEEICKRDELPDAMICANDIMALNVQDYLSNHGISVPKDMIVSGFDGIDEVFFCSPLLTTASCDTSLLADACAKMTLDLISGKPVNDAKIMPKMIVNESCGCAHQAFPAQMMMTRMNNSFYRHQDDSRILYEIAARMETQKTFWDMAAAIHDHKTKNSLCVVDLNCFEKKKHYFLMPLDQTKKRNLHLINDAEYAEEHRDKRLPLPKEIFFDDTINTEENVLSGNFRDLIISRANTKYPLIFNALDYMNRPFGFLCYFFYNYTITEYARTASMAGAMSAGMGGFVNNQYQQYLLDTLDTMYKHDSLTGLYNRLGFQSEFSKITEDPSMEGTSATVIMSDMDGLKHINDTYGHAEGDNAIATVAKALLSSCPDTSLCARFGGDELFSVVIGECDSNKIIERINRYLENYNQTSGLPYSVNTSCGYSVTKISRDIDFASALKLADKQMYKAKIIKKT